MKQKLQLILKFAKPHKWKFIMVFICILAATFSGAFYPYIFGRLVDEVFYRKNMSAFINIVLVYLGVFLFNQSIHLCQNITWTSLLTQFVFDIKTTIFNKVLSYNGKTLANLHSGDIISRMNKDTEGFMNFICWNTFYSISGVLNIVLSIVFMWNYSKWIALFTMILTPIIVYTTRYFSKKAKKFYTDLSKQKGLLTSWIFEIVKGMQEVRLLNAAKSVICDFTQRNIKIVRVQIKSSKVEVISERVNSGVLLLAQMILYAISALLIFREKLTIGGFTACVSYFGICIAAFNVLNDRLINTQYSLASVERVMEILNDKSEDYNIYAIERNIAEGKVSFSDVCFKYNNEVDVLKCISFDVKPHEQVAIVGHSGAGKTTLVNLLSKLYDVDSGKISIDGINVNEYNLHDLRNQIGVVHQEFILFEGTIRFNISFDNKNSDDDRVLTALKNAHLYDFIVSLPNKLDTIIGTSGFSLSGGQKQRLAIARMLYKNPKILVFDESTSSLDSETESFIKEAWANLRKERTVFVIAAVTSKNFSHKKTPQVREVEVK